jgi:type II secretory pathway component GspD/PulD (secretin)
MRCFLFAALCCWMSVSTVYAQTDGDARPSEKKVSVIEVEVTLAEWLSGGNEAAASLSGDTAEIAERVAALEKQGKLSIVQRFRLTTVDGQSAVAQQGENRPRVTSVAMTSRGGPQNSLQYQQIGSLVSVDPTVTDDSILLKLTVERSGIVTRPDAAILAEPPMGDKIRAESTTTLRLQSTLQLTSGQTRLLAGISGNDERTAVLISAKILK